MTEKKSYYHGRKQLCCGEDQENNEGISNKSGKICQKSRCYKINLKLSQFSWNFIKKKILINYFVMTEKQTRYNPIYTFNPTNVQIPCQWSTKIPLKIVPHIFLSYAYMLFKRVPVLFCYTLPEAHFRIPK